MTQTIDSPVTARESEAAVAAETGGRAPEPSRPRRRRIRGTAGRALRALGASAGLLAALVVVAACAAYLTFPHATVFKDVHRVPKLAALIPLFALGAVLAAVAAWRAAARVLRGSKAANVMTVIAAVVATGVSATGMWAFFAIYIPSIPVALRVPLFAFLELTTLAEGLRARDNMRDFGSSGVDGKAMWGAAITGAVLSSMASTSFAEAIFRVVPPLVAAGLWERALVSERRRNPERQRADDKKITWLISPARILVRLGLAEPAGKTLGEAAAQRRITLVALAADTATRAQQLPPGSSQRRRADARLRQAMRKAVAETDLATSPELQRSLFAQIGALSSTRDLVAGDTMAPWQKVAADRRRRTDDRKDDRDRRDDDRQDQDDTDRRRHDDTASPLAVLAGQLIPAVRQQDAGQVHRLLAGRSDYETLVRHLGASEVFGVKRVMAIVAIYAQPAAAETQSRNATWAAWVAGLVAGDAGKVDRAEFRRMFELIAPVWQEEGYPAAAGDTEPEVEQKAG